MKALGRTDEALGWRSIEVVERRQRRTLGPGSPARRGCAGRRPGRHPPERQPQPPAPQRRRGRGGGDTMIWKLTVPGRVTDWTRR